MENIDKQISINAIELENIQVEIGRRSILKEVSFQVSQNCVHGFLGPNGAGKSTTMRVITGVLAPISGQVKLFGETMSPDAYKLKSQIGYLPENPPLYDDMSVIEYLRFLASLRGEQDLEYLNYTMSRLQISEVKDRLIGNLSRGFRQRVAIAQALVHQPKIVILDEPTLGLDPHAIVEVRHLIESLASEHTVLLSSHQLDEVEKICEEVTLIQDGQILASGKVDEVKARKKTKTVKIMIKADDLNFDSTLEIEALDYIHSVRSISASDNGLGELEIIMDDQNEFRKKLVRDLVSFNINPITVHIEDSLENHFLQEIKL